MAIPTCDVCSDLVPNRNSQIQLKTIGSLVGKAVRKHYDHNNTTENNINKRLKVKYNLKTK